MDPDLAKVFTELHHRLVHLWILHKEYRDLFVSGRYRIELLMDTAPSFFQVVAESMAHDLIMRLSAMTDRDAMGKYEHLTITRLPSMVDDIYAEIDRAVNDAVGTITNTIRPWRDKYLAHHDLSLALGNLRDQPPVLWSDINTALTSIGNVLNAIAAHHGRSFTSYQDSTSQTGGSIALLGHLLTSRVRREKWAQLNVSEYEDELPPPDF